MIKNVIMLTGILAATLVCGWMSDKSGQEQGPSQQPQQSQPVQPAQSSPEILPLGQLVSEAREGDFVLQLTTDKSQYGLDEAVTLKVRLKYVGDLPQVLIGHAASPFFFAITETTRDIGVGYVMNQPLIRRTLVKDEWFEETYTKTGGYAETDPAREFIKQFLEGQAFPKGVYRIGVYADFILYQGEPDQPDTKEVDFRFQTAPLQIEVK